MTQIGRRTLLMAGLGLGLRQTDPASSRPKIGDLFVKPGDAARTPLAPGDIPLGTAQTLAWPMDPSDGTVRSSAVYSIIEAELEELDRSLDLTCSRIELSA